MVKVYNTRNISSMDSTTSDLIQSLGIPLEMYTTGKITLGPINKSAVTKFANINTLITKHNLPLPPSVFMEWVVDRCTGESKQDFREIIDAPPGYGKSYSKLYDCGRYAIEAAALHGQDPKDYFSMDNCALLQDTAGVTYLMDGLDKFQAVLIDDAGVAAGNKDFLTQSNKNLAAIMATCRTKRWYVNFTAPMNKHLDLSIRELVYAKSRVYKPCHAARFNILKRSGISMQVRNGRYREYNPHFVIGGSRIDMYSAFSPDLLDPYDGITLKYDTARDAAAISLIHERAVSETNNKDPRTKREREFDDLYKEHRDRIYSMTHDSEGNWLDRKSPGYSSGCGTYSVKKIGSETGMSEHRVNMCIARIKSEEVVKL